MEASTWLTFNTSVWCSTPGLLFPPHTFKWMLRVLMSAPLGRHKRLRCAAPEPKTSGRENELIPSSFLSLCCDWIRRSQFSKHVWVHPPDVWQHREWLEWAPVLPSEGQGVLEGPRVSCLHKPGCPGDLRGLCLGAKLCRHRGDVICFYKT